MSIDENGPFDDPLFSALARHHGCHDRGAHWHLVDLSPMHGDRNGDWGRATARGFGSDRLRGLPAGMPRFRFARVDGRASLMVDGRGYVYSNSGGTRQIAVQQATLPDTLLAAAPGRRLSDYVDLPGATDETISDARNGTAIGSAASIVLTLT